MTKDTKKIAYFSLEVALDNDLKTYAGGLGVLAGDLLRTAADLKIPFCGVTLLNSQGYFQQKIDSSGQQIVETEDNPGLAKLEKLPNQVTVRIENEEVSIGVWRYLITGRNGFIVPVYLLDTNLENNSIVNRNITSQLYGGDTLNRLKQQIVLGCGGVKMLESLKEEIKKFHLNEGHSVFVALELFLNSQENNLRKKVKAIRKKCLFTIHTSLPAAQALYSLKWLLKIKPDLEGIIPEELVVGEKIDLNKVGLYFSGFINGVSKAHQKFLKNIFTRDKINNITNGVRAATWTSASFREVYNQYLPGWLDDNKKLGRAKRIPLTEVWASHQKAKSSLLEFVKDKTGVSLAKDKLTIVWARRIVAYKQATFLFKNLEELLRINKDYRGVQIIFAGKAHPGDLVGQAIIAEIQGIKKILSGQIEMVFLENYDLEQAKLLVAGADLWLNTPLAPSEASGTSGMKAALNGIPQVSTLDGWWLEGYLKNKTGWLVNSLEDLYKILKIEILPTYYEEPEKWQQMMREVISKNAAHFNSARMLKEYQKKAY